MDPDQNNPNNPPPAGGQPDLGSTPTFTPPPAPSSPPPAPETPPPPVPMTPLDNPLQAPSQPPPIDSGFSWPGQAQPSAPSISPQDLYGPSAPPSSPPPETAPTDLSHLVAGNGNDQQVYTPPVTQPETLVAPASSSDEIPNAPIENRNGGMPKWVLGLGIGILLAVVGASAYLILGIGRQTENTPASLPITTKQQTLTPPPASITTAPTPATSAGSFGQLNGTKPATSAADLLKQRQGR